MPTLKPGHGLDTNGYIVSDVDIKNIKHAFLPCIQDSITSLQESFPQLLHSIYLYGSAPRGDARIPYSDLDLIALFTNTLSAEQLKELKQIVSELSKKYQSLVREVGIAIAYYDDIMDPANYYENAFIKELSVNVYGEDVGRQFGPYKLTAEIAVSFNGDILAVLHRTLDRLKKAADNDYKKLVQNFSRKLIRTYYSMVMVRSQVWTTRLLEQANVYIRYFPDKEPVIFSLLKWIDEPALEKKTVMTLFKREGEWASKNFIHEATISS